MKVRFGDMTINQTIEICKGNYRGACNGCPLYHEDFRCIAFVPPHMIKLCDLNEMEIELPDSIQTTDVAPIVHAHWYTYPDDKQFKCSNCKTGVDLPTLYCPHCGAKMDEEVDKND